MVKCPHCEKGISLSWNHTQQRFDPTKAEEFVRDQRVALIEFIRRGPAQMNRKDMENVFPGGEFELIEWAHGNGFVVIDHGSQSQYAFTVAKPMAAPTIIESEGIKFTEPIVETFNAETAVRIGNSIGKESLVTQVVKSWRDRASQL